MHMFIRTGIAMIGVVFCMLAMACSDSEGGDGATGATGNTGGTANVTPWTRLLGSVEPDEARGIAVDAQGNVYVAGSTLGAIAGLDAPDSEAALLVKYDPTGTRLWAVLADTDAKDYLMDVALDGAGNVFVTGGTYGNLFGQTNRGSQDAFVAKYDADGTLQWGKLFGTSAGTGNFGENGQKLATDAAGNVYVVGITDGGLGDTYIGYNALYVMKLDGSGNREWLQVFGVAGTGVFNFGYGIALAGEALYVTGSMGADFDGQTHLGNGDPVLIKLAAADGAKQWTRMAGSTRGETGSAVTVDSAGHIYVTGRSQGHFDGNTNPSSGGVQARIILIKYDADGNKLWSRIAPGQITNNAEAGRGVVVAPNGSVYIAGYYANADEFDIKDLVVLEYSASGELLDTWLENNGENEEAYAIAVDAANTLYLAGMTGSDMDGQSHVGPEGSYDIFIRKMPAP